MNRYARLTLAAALLCCAIVPGVALADVIVADDFFYIEPTKELGPGGGFNKQDYGGGQNGPLGQWNGRWVSSGNGIITGPDFAEVDKTQRESPCQDIPQRGWLSGAHPGHGSG